MSTDPESKCEGDANHVQYVQNEYQLNYWVKTIWGWVNPYMGTNNVNYHKEVWQWVSSGLIHTLGNVKLLYVDNLVCSPRFKKN